MNSYDTTVSQIKGLQGTIRAGLHESHDRANGVEDRMKRGSDRVNALTL
jgi:hypothetical protein